MGDKGPVTRVHCASCGRHRPDELKPAPGGALMCTQCRAVAEAIAKAQGEGRPRDLEWRLREALKVRCVLADDGRVLAEVLRGDLATDGCVRLLWSTGEAMEYPSGKAARRAITARAGESWSIEDRWMSEPSGRSPLTGTSRAGAAGA